MKVHYPHIKSISQKIKVYLEHSFSSMGGHEILHNVYAWSGTNGTYQGDIIFLLEFNIFILDEFKTCEPCIYDGSGLQIYFFLISYTFNVIFPTTYHPNGGFSIGNFLSNPINLFQEKRGYNTLYFSCLQIHMDCYIS